MKKIKEYTVCRACGEALLINGAVLKCPECGAQMIFPTDADSEIKQHYNDAFRYLLHDDFYSAIRLFEAIIKTAPSAASHFGAFIAKYGLGADREHITGNIVHSCKRRSTADPMKDADYLAALSYADNAQKSVLNETADFICKEQKRLETAERIAAEKEEEKIGESGLSSEFEAAQKKAEDAERKKAEEAKRIADEEARRDSARRARIEKAKRDAQAAKIVKISLLAVACVACIAFAVTKLIIPAVNYSKAVKNYEAGNYAVAADIFRDLGDYKQSEEYLATVPFYGLTAGDEVTFGKYHHHNGVAKYDIEWVVLEADDESVLLISKYVLDVKKYHEKHISVTWETSDLRTYLNGEFLAAAFTGAEQNRILTVKLENPDVPTQGTLGGEDTEDKVFILSNAEAEKYLVGKDYAYGVPTPYVSSLGVYIDEEGNTGRCWYWLRSPGASQSSVSKIDYDGTVNYRGTMVDYTKYGVRPAIRVSVEKIGSLID
ncbi:MAG: cell envelope integrity protein TolA [Clostridia bacterium]|nr:cell envelope integrity protein TolA [Clostridia bacterium]